METSSPRIRERSSTSARSCSRFGTAVALILTQLALAAPTAAWAAQVFTRAPASLPPAAAEPRSEAEIEEAIREVLVQRHPRDTATWWRSLGPAAPRVIIRHYQSLSDRPDAVYPRLRLVEALGYFDDPQAAEFLKQQAEATSEDVVRNAAVKSIGSSQGAKEAESVGKYLAHADPQTRLAAAQALQRMDDARARALLERYLSEEKTSWVVSALKGEKILPHKPLVAVASSEDRVNPVFAGVWRGYLITPSEGERGMSSDGATLKISVEGSASIRGELTLVRPAKGPGGEDGKARSVVLQLAGMKAKGLRLSVMIPKSPAGALALEGELSEQAAARPGQGPRRMLELRAPQVGGMLILRRDP